MNPYEMKVLTLEGAPSQNGRAHGDTLRAQIQAMAAERTAGVESYFKISMSKFLDILFEETSFYQAAERWTPQLVEEVRGIGEGAGLDSQSAFAWQLLDEMDWYLRQKTNPALTSDPNRCSALGAYGAVSDPAIIAQNADMGKSVDGLGIILHKKYTDCGMQTLAVSIPGVLGIWGINSKAVGVCMNAMDIWLNHARDGLGTIFVSGGILSQPSFTEADRFVRSVKHASGENYVIGAPGIAADYEGSANQVVQYIPYPGAQVVFHTNHQIVNTDVELTPERELALPEDLRQLIALGRQDTTGRFCSVEARMKSLESPLTVEKVKEILSAHDDANFPVCKHKREDRQGMTNFCIIMELSDIPAFHVSSGPPCMTEFRTFRFTE